MAASDYDQGGGPAHRVAVGRLVRLCIRPVQAVAFWAATVLPVCGVVTLFLAGWTPLTALLFLASAVTIFVGHPYGR